MKHHSIRCLLIFQGFIQVLFVWAAFVLTLVVLVAIRENLCNSTKHVVDLFVSQLQAGKLFFSWFLCKGGKKSIYCLFFPSWTILKIDFLWKCNVSIYYLWWCRRQRSNIISSVTWFTIWSHGTLIWQGSLSQKQPFLKSSTRPCQRSESCKENQNNQYYWITIPASQIDWGIEYGDVIESGQEPVVPTRLHPYYSNSEIVWWSGLKLQWLGTSNGQNVGGCWNSDYSTK